MISMKAAAATRACHEWSAIIFLTQFNDSATASGLKVEEPNIATAASESATNSGSLLSRPISQITGNSLKKSAGTRDFKRQTL